MEDREGWRGALTPVRHDASHRRADTHAVTRGEGCSWRSASACARAGRSFAGRVFEAARGVAATCLTHAVHRWAPPEPGAFTRRLQSCQRGAGSVGRARRGGGALPAMDGDNAARGARVRAAPHEGRTDTAGP